MSVAAASPRPVPRPRPLLWPILWAVALASAVFLVPFPGASLWPDGGYPSRAALVDSLGSAFIRYWDAGSGLVGPDLALAVDFWRRFHVVKAVLAALLLVVLVTLCSRAWTASSRAATAARRRAAGALAVSAALLALVSVVFLVANLQGAVAPLSSALGLLPIASPGPRLAETITQVRSGLADGARSPALVALVHDFTVYHVAMAALGAAVAVALLGGAVLLWRRRSGMPARHAGRGLLLLAIVTLVASAAFFGVVAAGNLSTVAHPVPALIGFFEGGA